MRSFCCSLLLLLLALAAFGQESPIFITYDHHMEEAGNLEISTQSTVGLQRQDLPRYWGQLLELEYGMTDRWSSSLYLEGASQQHDSTVFTGWRVENRFRPLQGEHKINPVLYFEFEDINEASRIKKEIVGHAEPSGESLSQLRGNKARELEGKLILSSDVHKWNISENFILEKNLTQNEGVEVGYSLGAYRPLATVATAKGCTFCRDNFMAGMELYGGLGSTQQFGFADTAHYLAPGLLWRVGKNTAVKVSPAFGLTKNSDRMLLRFGYTYEINGFGSKLKHLFGAR
jgi:hypothetical protein